MQTGDRPRDISKLEYNRGTRLIYLRNVLSRPRRMSSHTVITGPTGGICGEALEGSWTGGGLDV